MPFNVPEKWIYQQIRENQAIDSMSTKFSAQQKLVYLQVLARKKLFKLLESRQVLWIDPFQKLCNKNDCMLVNNGISYFKDVTHLSEAGAMLFTSNFATALGQ